MEVKKRKRVQTEHKKEYDRIYRREKKLSIAFRLSKIYEQDLIDIYQSIPDKSAWFKECLRNYKSR